MVLYLLIIKCLLLVLLVYWVAGIYYYAQKRPEYSHIVHSISELGENNSKYEKPVSYGLFLPIGVLFFIVAWLYNGTSSVASLLSAFMGVGYFFSAFFPCDPQTPLLGTWKNTLHNLAGGICYVGCLVVLQEAYSDDGEWLSGVVLYALMIFLLIFMLGWPKITGLLQRVVEFGIIAVIFFHV